MKQNYLIGIGLIGFGIYLLLVKLNIIIAFDFMLLIALAFLGGYIYRRSTNEGGATGLLLVGSVLSGIYLSNHLGVWLGGVPGLEWLRMLDTVFYIGLAFLFTWLVEQGFGGTYGRRQTGFLFIGFICAFVGGYDALMSALHISPQLIRNLFLPTVFILIGLSVLLGSRKKLF